VLAPDARHGCCNLVSRVRLGQATCNQVVLSLGNTIVEALGEIDNRQVLKRHARSD
jgi:hypothetical protein